MFENICQENGLINVTNKSKYEKDSYSIVFGGYKIEWRIANWNEKHWWFASGAAD